MKIHCIGIGERTMCHLALALVQKGYTVTGSDVGIASPLKHLLDARGLLPQTLGWHPEKIQSTLDAVLVGTKVATDNPELLRVQELGVRLYSYAEFLYEQSQHKTRVIISGSRGKAIIVAMILHVLRYHNLPIDYSMETCVAGSDRMVHLTENNDFILIEGDIGSHLYRPNIALLSDITWETSEAFPAFEAYIEHFQCFVDSIVKGGSITYNEEDSVVKKIVESSENTIRKLAYQTPCHQIVNGTTLLNTPEGAMPIEISSMYTLNHLSGARWICQHMGLDEIDFYEAIASFATTPSLH